MGGGGLCGGCGNSISSLPSGNTKSGEMDGVVGEGRGASGDMMGGVVGEGRGVNEDMVGDYAPDYGAVW